MFFTERERAIYQPAGSEHAYDPLLIDRNLIVLTEGRLNDLVADINALAQLEKVAQETGLPPPADQVREALVARSRAELELIPIVRKVFVLDDNLHSAAVLETLYNFLGWLEGKDETAGMPPLSPSPSASRPG